MKKKKKDDDDDDDDDDVMMMTMAMTNDDIVIITSSSSSSSPPPPPPELLLLILSYSIYSSSLIFYQVLQSREQPQHSRATDRRGSLPAGGPPSVDDMVRRTDSVRSTCSIQSNRSSGFIDDGYLAVRCLLFVA